MSSWKILVVHDQNKSYADLLRECYEESNKMSKKKFLLGAMGFIGMNWWKIIRQ